jgi:hypothetical protein
VDLLTVQYVQSNIEGSLGRGNVSILKRHAVQ